MSDDLSLDLSNVPEPSTAPVWRAEAIRLAARRDLIGQVSYSSHEGQHAAIYRCVSANEVSDHFVIVYSNPDLGVYVHCDCPAAQHGKPCAHAGATLLCVFGLAPARQRDPEGFTRNG